ncbi:sensor histidine kinase [Micromonospora sp. WMMD812]|uniref:sensor histidine kinase n=1 Tax=Micromonospora sp. WMMD812 TaxID=3015152 RepID=UPI00248B603B|nr:sensor histidine kinase [Micromonospora sp. WMMD812]WBB68653.1 sensor histidine kinase [Micromonospora sp. WMMD812]
MTEPDTAVRPAGGLAHEGFFYGDPRHLLDGAVPFIEHGLAGGEPVLVALPTANLELVRDAVGEAPGLYWTDMAEAGRNPGAILPWVLQAFIDRHPGRRTRIVGESVWSGRSLAEHRACAQHEALVNAALAGHGVSLLCPYDAGRLDQTVLADACATHPVIVDADGRRPSNGFAPSDVVVRYDGPLPAPPDPVAALRYGLDDLADVRRFVAGHAEDAGLVADRVADLQIAVTEVAANSVLHGGGGGTLRVWRTDDDLVCEFHDDGWLSNPLAGRLTPARDGEGGRGLVIVHALCDLVLLHSTAAGTTVRLHMRR